MNLNDFRELEKELGHPPTREEVREYQARPRLKSAYVQFANPKYNYSTSVNGKLKDEAIVDYFKNKWFNLGHIEDDMQMCTACTVGLSSISLN